MAELIKLEIVDMPELLVVGKKLDVEWSKIHEHNPIPDFWQECMKDGTFKELEALADFVFDPSYVGYMDMQAYYCGMLMKPGCSVPDDGFVAEKILPVKAAVTWIKGKEPDIYMQAHMLSEAAMREKGYDYHPNCMWSMELYNCPRFTEKDGDGNVTLDYYIAVAK